jgi:hypothetical protein
MISTLLGTCCVELSKRHICANFIEVCVCVCVCVCCVSLLKFVQTLNSGITFDVQHWCHREHLVLMRIMVRLASVAVFDVNACVGDAMLPFAALFNHSTTNPHIHVEDAANDVGTDDDSNDASTSTDMDHPSHYTHLSVTLVRAAKRGDELLNTYDE